MPTFKYQAALPSGIWIFGIFDAADEGALQAYLKTRGMTLVEASELTINSALVNPSEEVPRMLQMRIGERLREALLTEMPAHEAVSAIANEPFEHPVLLMMPWVGFISAFGAVGAILLSAMIPEARTVLWSSAGFIVGVTMLIWWLAWLWFIARPRAILRRMAARLERGGSEALLNAGLMPFELRAIVNSKMESRSKVACLAELIPTLSGVQMQTHQFAARLLGPLLAMSLLVIGIHVLLLTVMAQFKEIFVSFGLELPALTVMLITLSDWAQKMGIPGLVALSTLLLGMLAMVYGLVVWPRTAELFESVPGLGLSVRWLMQARVARILGVLIRNHASPSEAIVVASKASGFQSVADDGEQIASMIGSGNTELNYSRRLSGLPLAMLFRLSDGKQTERARQETAQSFQMYAASLEEASAGNGAFLAVVFEMLIILVGGVMIGIFVTGLFLPLIRLLDALAVIVWSVA